MHLGTRRDEDDVDRANFDFNRELALSLSNGEREVLVLISEALDRLDLDSFGNCCNFATGTRTKTNSSISMKCYDTSEISGR